MGNVLIEKIKEIGIAYKQDILLSEYTTFRVGGKCPLAVFPESAEDCAAVVKLLKEMKIPYFVLGKGSNILAADRGYSGVLILTERMRKLSCNQEKIQCGAGVSLSKFCSFALENSLNGAEFAWGIPGSIGGAIYMNAGAYGGEISDIIHSCTFLNEQGEICTVQAEKLELSYRHSVFTGSRSVILEAEFLLHTSDMAAIKAQMDDYITRRMSKQPLDKPSAGSTFKRPQGAYAAALIEESGLKGCSVGGARVSEKHSGFIINDGQATAEDIAKLIQKVQKTVKKETGYSLACEVIPLGFLPEEIEAWTF